MTNVFIKEFIKQSVYRIWENTQKIIKCLDEIDDLEIWKSPNDNSNSIGNIILHLCGNIRQYAISALSATKDARERDKEFSAKGGHTKSGLLNELTDTVSEAAGVIKNIDENGLTRIYSVQGSDLSGIGIIIHVTEHYSYHTGQIVFWIKQIRDKDLEFYANINLNLKNKNDKQ